MAEHEAEFDLNGIKIIGEMSKQELIDELMNVQRSLLEETGMEQLKRHVINYRLAAFQRRLVAEAGIEPITLRGLLGWKEDEDDD